MKLHNPFDYPSFAIAYCLACCTVGIVALLVFFAMKALFVLLGVLFILSVIRTMYYVFTGE
jgi:hypothetical protein